jgi:glycosyltransferase involved in cell wall biosynthesis
MTCPRIAVIVPAYRVAGFLPEALDSLLAQELEDWEAVVIDDGSPDEVAVVVEPYLRDSRIRFLATANRGVSAARNHAIAHSRAPLVALLDGDDRMRPRYLSCMAEALEGDPDAMFATCDACFFGAGARAGQRVNAGRVNPRVGTLAGVLDRSFNVYGGATFRRSGFERIGGFDPDLRGAEDWDFFLRLLIGGGHGLYVDEVLADYRVRPGSASADMLLMLEGERRLYAKAIATLAGRPEAALAKRLAAELEQQLAFQQGIRDVIAGDRKAGLARIRSGLPADASPGWWLALALWGALPFLARPMLAARQRRHARHNLGL